MFPPQITLGECGWTACCCAGGQRAAEGVSLSSGEIVTIVAAVLALVGSLITLFFSSRLAIRRERRMLLWGKQLDRLLELEDVAGQLVDLLEKDRSDGASKKRYLELRTRLETLAGTLRRYPEVSQMIEKLRAGAVECDRRKTVGQDCFEVVKEVEAAHRDLLRACDREIDRSRVVSRGRR